MRTEEQVTEQYNSYLALYADQDAREGGNRTLYFGALGALGFTLGKTVAQIGDDVDEARAEYKRKLDNPPVRSLSLIEKFGDTEK